MINYNLIAYNVSKFTEMKMNNKLLDTISHQIINNEIVNVDEIYHTLNLDSKENYFNNQVRNPNNYRDLQLACGLIYFASVSQLIKEKVITASVVEMQQHKRTRILFNSVFLNGEKVSLSSPKLQNIENLNLKNTLVNLKTIDHNPTLTNYLKYFFSFEVKEIEDRNVFKLNGHTFYNHKDEKILMPSIEAQLEKINLEMSMNQEIKKSKPTAKI